MKMFPNMRTDANFKNFSLAIIWFWVILFALLPFCLVTVASFLSHNEAQLLKLPFTLDNYITLFNNIYFKIFQRSFYLAGICTLLCLLIGYPFAFALARMQTHWKNFFLLLVIIPFWTSSLIRTYSMITILKPKGLLNSILMHLGIIKQPIAILFTDTAVVIGLIYNLLPFMILPLLTNIERLDKRLVDAAHDLGANRFTTFTKIILPLTIPGILAGSILVFLPAMTIFYIPDLLGGARSILLGNLIQNQFLTTQNWPLGSAISIIFTCILGLLLLIYWHSMQRGERGRPLL